MPNFIHVFMIIFIIFTSCQKIISPEDNKGEFIVDSQNFESSQEVTDSTFTYHVGYLLIYHFENSGGNLTEYSFSIQNVDTKFGIASGWDDRVTSRRRGKLPKYNAEFEKDTLQYEKSFSVSLHDTSDFVFKFYVQGYYYNEPLLFSELEKSQNLDGFLYFFSDTIKFN